MPGERILELQTAGKFSLERVRKAGEPFVGGWKERLGEKAFEIELGFLAFRFILPKEELTARRLGSWKIPD